MRITSIFGALIASAALAACGGDSGEQASDTSETMDAGSGNTETSADDMSADENADAPSDDMDGGDSGAMDDDSGAMDAEASADAEAEAEGGSGGMADAGTSGDAFMVAGLTGDAEAGRRVFARCRSCHVLEEGVNRVGPSLYGIFGRDAGSVEGFRYSDANASSGITWTPETMFEYLENPREYIPGTNMAFPGLRDEQDRADILAYISANGGDAG